jgi:hypothetical protein
MLLHRHRETHPRSTGSRDFRKNGIRRTTARQRNKQGDMTDPNHTPTCERLLFLQRRCIALNPDIPGWEHGSYNYPIRLADVLPAMEAARHYIGVMDDGKLVHLSADLNARRYTPLRASWDITSDDLQSQSEETINTLYELLL